MADASPSGNERSGHPILRFLLTAGLIAAFTAALARWLRGPSTQAFNEPSVWPPAKPWPRLDEPSKPAATEPVARRTAQVVKKSSGQGGAAKKTVRIQAKAPAAPPAGAVWKAAAGKSCPDGYPIKVKVRSGLYHEPGMFVYDRTNPDRCYPNAEAAEADGFTRAKR